MKAAVKKKPSAAPPPHPPPEEEEGEGAEAHEEAEEEAGLEEEEEEGEGEGAEEEYENVQDEVVDPDLIDGPGEVRSLPAGGQIRVNRRRVEFYSIVQMRPGLKGSWKQVLQFSDKQFEKYENPRQLCDRACKESFCFELIGRLGHVVDSGFIFGPRAQLASRRGQLE